MVETVSLMRSCAMNRTRSLCGQVGKSLVWIGLLVCFYGKTVRFVAVQFELLEILIIFSAVRVRTYRSDAIDCNR